MTPNPVRKALVAVLLSLTGLLGSGGGVAASYDRIVVFGDSLTDPGNAFVLLSEVTVPPFEALIPSAPYARGGLHFSNGVTWVEQLADALGLNRSAGPGWRVPGVFSNYAVGGARARLAEPTDLTGQVNRFLSDFGGVAPADALYVVHIGGDDLRDAVEALGTDPSGATSVTIIGEALAAIAQNISVLASVGARTFLVPNAPDLALVPAVALLGQPVQQAATRLAMAFNAGLEATLRGLETGLPLTVVRVDVFALLHEVVAARAAFGLSDVADPCIMLSPSPKPFCSRPDEFLFWDGIHPTRAGHAILARQAHEILTAH